VALFTQDRKAATDPALGSNQNGKDNGMKVTVHGAGGGEVTGAAYLL
jgi:hypothetical protein